MFTAFKSLKEISWQVDEPTYRADPAYSYSTLAKYARVGFDGISTLDERVETPSLTFGSMVDTWLTDGEIAFYERYAVATMPDIEPAIEQIVKLLFEQHGDTKATLGEVTDNEVAEVVRMCNWQPRWGELTRVNKVRASGSEYYNALAVASGKQVVSSEMFDDMLACVNALRTSTATSWYFAPDNPFVALERLYQLKFKGEYKGIPVRCMMDLVIVDHVNKVIYPCDLKTSSKPEHKFYKSFIEWNYDIQARLYTEILKQNLAKDPYFKDFKVENYRFIVVSNKTRNPLVWRWDYTHSSVDITVGDTTFIYWGKLLESLAFYQKYMPALPREISDEIPNNLAEWINKEHTEL